MSDEAEQTLGVHEAVQNFLLAEKKKRGTSEAEEDLEGRLSCEAVKAENLQKAEEEKLESETSEAEEGLAFENLQKATEEKKKDEEENVQKP